MNDKTHNKSYEIIDKLTASHENRVSSKNHESMNLVLMTERI